MKKLDELQQAAVSELVNYFQGSPAKRRDVQVAAKMAVSSLSAVGRIKATERAGDATQLEVLRNMAANRDQFAEYVAASLPHLNPTKKIARNKP